MSTLPALRWIDSVPAQSLQHSLPDADSSVGVEKKDGRVALPQNKIFTYLIIFGMHNRRSVLGFALASNILSQLKT